MQRWLRVKNTMDYKHQDGNLMRDCRRGTEKKGERGGGIGNRGDEGGQ